MVKPVGTKEMLKALKPTGPSVVRIVKGKTAKCDKIVNWQNGKMLKTGRGAENGKNVKTERAQN